MMPDLVIFTAGFPFHGMESVLAGELEVTAQQFGRVWLVPTRSGASARRLPENVEVVDLGWHRDWPRAAKKAALRSRPACEVLAETMRQPSNWRGYMRAGRTYLDLLATSILKARSLQAWIAEAQLADALFYDYWFENSTLALALLRSEGVIRCAVSRAHRFDVYDDRWGALGHVPFREYKLRHLDAVFPISEDAAAYMRGRARAQRGKSGRVGHPDIRVARLGVPAARTEPPPGDGPPLIVSCSTLASHKRVHLIPAALGRLSERVRWIHFGDGVEAQRVRAAAAGLPDNVEWELRGAVGHDEVQRFYADHTVSLFVSASATEGIPVSMMEVQRFGVPIVATAVGGVPELVTPETGILLDQHVSPREMAAAIHQGLTTGRFDRHVIRAAFSRRFDAAVVYPAFAAELLDVWSSTECVTC